MEEPPVKALIFNSANEIQYIGVITASFNREETTIQYIMVPI